MDKPRYDVFLSHATLDKPVVEDLARRLRTLGFEPWLDKWNLIPGEPWQEAIEKALEECATCAVCLGPSGTGPWQNEEMRTAIDRRVADRSRHFRVIPVLLPGSERGEASRLPAFLRATTWVEFRDTLDDDKALHRLVSGIRGLPPGADPGEAVAQGAQPYRGLQVFDVGDALFFFGREALTEWLLDKLRADRSGNRFLAIVGPSGSGKSSLARAGLVAALKRGEISGSGAWPVAIFKPGAQPLESLAVALSGAVRPGDSPSAVLNLIRDLGAHPRMLHLTTRLFLREAPADRRLVVLVDQFEEIFTLCPDEEQRKAIIANLLHAATAADGQTVVVLTLRADFYGRCAAYPDLATAVSDRQSLVGPMTRDELRSAIERPAYLAGCELEGGLTDLLLNEVESQPGSLPLLEHALLQLWQRREGGRRLTIAAYREIGGVAGALEKHVEEVYSGFSDEEKEVCRRIFLRLVQVDEQGRATKRRLNLDELDAATVVAKLIDSRLLTTDQEKRATVEVAHEALLGNWGRLKEWIEQDREALRTRRRLDEAVAEWIGNGQDTSFLYSGARLVQAEEWAENRSGDLTILAQNFLTASLVRRSEEHRLELTRTQALEEEKHRYIEVDRKRKRVIQRSKILTIGLLVFLTIAMIGISSAIQQKQRLEARRNVKIAENLANRALAIQEANPILSQLLSMEAMRIARNNGEPRLPTAEGTLRSLLADAGGMPLAHDKVRMVSISPDHQWLAIGKADGNTSLWHFTDKGPRPSAVTPANLRDLALLAVSPGGRWLLQATHGGRTRLLDLSGDSKDPRHLYVLDGQDWPAGSMPFSPKGRWLAMRTTKNGSPSLALRNMFELTKSNSIDATDPTAFAFSHDEKWFASATADNFIRIWDLATPGAPTLFASFKNNRGSSSSLRFLGDKWLLSLATGSAQGSIQAWRLSPNMAEYPLRRDNQRCDGSEQMSAAMEDSAVVSWGKDIVCTWVSTGDDVLVATSTDIRSGTFAALSPDGAWLATGYLGGQASFGPLGGEDDEFTSLPDQARPLAWLDFSGDSRWLVTWGGDESPRAWRVSQEKASLAADPEVIFYPGDKVTISPKGHRLEINDTAHKATLFDPSGKMITSSITFNEKVKWPWVFSPDGLWLAAGDTEGGIYIWRIENDRSMLPFTLKHYHVGAISALAFSPDGNWMASGDESGNSLLWNLHDLRYAPKPLTRHHASNVTALAFSQSGDSVATGGEDGKIYIRKISSDQIYSSDFPEAPQSRRTSVRALAFGPDGWLAISYEPSDVWLWRANSKPVLLEGPTLDTSILLFSPDNQWLIGGARSTYSLWNFSGEKTATTPVVLNDSADGDKEDLFGATFSPDSSKLISFGELGEVLRWELRNEKVHEIACEAAGRNLTEKEWTTYIPSEHYQENEPCPEFTKAYD